MFVPGFLKSFLAAMVPIGKGAPSTDPRHSQRDRAGELSQEEDGETLPVNLGGTAKSDDPATPSQSGPAECVEKPADRLKKLRDAVDRGGSQANANFLAYLAILIYFFVAVTSTTHEDLLRETPKAVPLLNVQLPLWWFFLIGPIALVLIHLNLLIQYFYLTRIVYLFDTYITDSKLSHELANEERNLPLNFVISNLILDKKMPFPMRPLMRGLLWTFVFLSPLVLLLLFQIYFLPYHDPFVTWTQRVMLIFDAVVLILLWQVIPRTLHYRLFRKSSREPGEQAVDTVMPFIQDPSLNPFRVLARIPSSTVLVFVFAIISLFCLAIPGEPVDSLRQRVLAWVDPELLDYSTDPRVDEWSQTLARLNKHLERNLNLPDKLLIKADPPAELVGRYAASPDKHDAVFVDLVKQYRLGLDLRGRDLRYANLTGSKLHSALIRGANFQNARLAKIQLQDANHGLSDQNIKYSHGESPVTNFSCADLQYSILNNADLSDSLFNDANLKYAHLKHAILIAVHFNDGDLSSTDLNGCNLMSARLNGANLSDSYLNGAILVSARLNGALLIQTQLMGAILGHANLKGAYLYAADLRGADLYFAELEGADLQKVKFEGARIQGANFDGADLTGARFDGVDARQAKFRNAIFLPEFVKDSDFRGAEFISYSKDEWDQFVKNIAKAVPDDERKDFVSRLGDVWLKTCGEKAEQSYHPTQPVGTLYGPRFPSKWIKSSDRKELIDSISMSRGIWLNAISCLNNEAGKIIAKELCYNLNEKHGKENEYNLNLYIKYLEGECNIDMIDVKCANCIRSYVERDKK